MTEPYGRHKRRGIPGRDSGRGESHRTPSSTPSAHPNPDENLIDESIDETFPASDPPAWSGTSTGEPCRAEDKAKDDD